MTRSRSLLSALVLTLMASVGARADIVDSVRRRPRLLAALGLTLLASVFARADIVDRLRRRRLHAALYLTLLLSVFARADIVDRLDQPAAEIAAAKWWGTPPLKMEEFRGKVIVLHVSDQARATSQAFVPNLRKFADAFKDEPVVFFEIVENDEQPVAADYVATAGATIAWSVGWDGTGVTQKGYPGSSLPRTYVIGPDGNVAWHMHIAALTKEVIDAQVARCAFWDPKLIPEKARLCAKYMFELRFGDATIAADKVFSDAYGGEDAKTFCARAKKEIARYYTFQMNVVEGLSKELDWSAAYHRVERMLVIYKGTDREPDVKKKWDQLNASERVLYLVEEQKRLDEMVKNYHRIRAKKDIEELIGRLRAFQEKNPGTALAKKASEWIAECERRMKRMGWLK